MQLRISILFIGEYDLKRIMHYQDARACIREKKIQIQIRFFFKDVFSP